MLTRPRKPALFFLFGGFFGQTIAVGVNGDDPIVAAAVGAGVHKVYRFFCSQHMADIREILCMVVEYDDVACLFVGRKGRRIGVEQQYAYLCLPVVQLNAGRKAIRGISYSMRFDQCV